MIMKGRKNNMKTGIEGDILMQQRFERQLLKIWKQNGKYSDVLLTALDEAMAEICKNRPSLYKSSQDQQYKIAYLVEATEHIAKTGADAVVESYILLGGLEDSIPLSQQAKGCLIEILEKTVKSAA